MIKILLYIWQLPQNLLGLIVILFSKARTNRKEVWWTEYNFGVSLGRYIILPKYTDEQTIKHEQGHQKQSLYLGWLYLLIIGLPSISGNIFDRLFHKDWSIPERVDWYYNLPWEHWADKLGNVNRFNSGV